jgi:hypothetical protein
MLFLVPFFTWLGIKQAVANDRLIEQLEAIRNSRRRIIAKLSRGVRVGRARFTFGLIWSALSFWPP